MARKQQRPSSQTRKASGGSSSLKRWKTLDDIEETEQDAFHRQRDKISLEGANGHGDAREEDEDEFDALTSGRGVLDVNEEEESEESDDEDEDDEHGEAEESDFDEAEATVAARKQSGAGKVAVDLSETDEDDDDHDDDENDGPTGGWGSNKQSYYSTNDLEQLSSDSEMDEDEKREMEIREVKRLQAKSRQNMTDEDFGLGEDSLRLENSLAARETRRKNFESAAETEKICVTSSADFSALTALQRAELVTKVQRTTPETLALVGEFADISEEIAIVSSRLKKILDTNGNEELAGLCCLHHQLLLTYAANLSFYFHLRATKTYAQNPEKLASHSVVARLLKFKTGLQLLDSYGLGADNESDSADEDGENIEPTSSFLFRPTLQENGGDDDSESLGSLEDDELMQLDREERENLAAAATKPAEKMQEAKRIAKAKKGKVKESKKRGEVAPLARVIVDLDNDGEEGEDSLGGIKKRKKAGLNSIRYASDAEAFNAFGEPTELSAVDSADKEARRRSLKFYTGQIVAKESRKAGGSGLGGDADIPYRDRERSRMAVANANARKTAAGSSSLQGDRTLDGDDWAEADVRDWKDVMDVEPSRRGGKGGSGEEEDDTDYYDLIASGKRSAKRAKKEEYDEERASQRVAPADDLEDGEHRGINRTIEKNRGLTPRRKKENRNPRVKKRLRYEAAKKKLSSRGPVYKGGQAALQGGYAGEQSGINSNVVKSRSFA